MNFERLFKFYAFATAANFFVFWIVAVWVGGDAINGHSGAGHFYLCAHGACHEVSRAIFTYSWWHTMSVIVSFVVLFSTAAVIQSRKNSS